MHRLLEENSITLPLDVIPAEFIVHETSCKNEAAKHTYFTHVPFTGPLHNINKIIISN